MSYSTKSFHIKERQALRRDLLVWYQEQGRVLPWRILPKDRQKNKTIDPYKVWLSEIMLQQTRVGTVELYWEKFMERWPTLEALAAADLDMVLTLWSGLGYYARARNLHKCAQYIVEKYQGVFPSSEQELLKLPGIGSYTAAALRAICFQQAANVVDGNVERVIARLHAFSGELPEQRAALVRLAGEISDPEFSDPEFSDPEFSGDYAQGLMDLGALLCKPKKPQCFCCPWQTKCRSFQAKDKNPETYPVKKRKKPKPTRYGVSFVCYMDALQVRDRKEEIVGNKPQASSCFRGEVGSEKNMETHSSVSPGTGKIRQNRKTVLQIPVEPEENLRILLQRRPLKGLLGGMTAFPGTPWRETPWKDTEINSCLFKTLEELPFSHSPSYRRERQVLLKSSLVKNSSDRKYKIQYKPMGFIRHAFTHFNLELEVWVCHVGKEQMVSQENRAFFGKQMFWESPAKLDERALPSVMKKFTNR